MPAQPHTITNRRRARELSTGQSLPSEATTVTVYIPHAVASTLAVGQVVQLRVTSSSALGVDPFNPNLPLPEFHGSLNLPVVGPVIATRVQDGREVEFMVKNDYEDNQSVAYVCLRVSQGTENNSTTSSEEQFAAELTRHMKMLESNSNSELLNHRSDSEQITPSPLTQPAPTWSVANNQIHITNSPTEADTPSPPPHSDFTPTRCCAGTSADTLYKVQYKPRISSPLASTTATTEL
ncbi:hypothetical protein TRAPUB_1709 [Trametes pubescens]|uniref:Uncharacterized protein n=1 Tax=Trametes pubescens TaxID=154538 RepID=A0A1M2VIL2_TRAPU|nr:hypothetical protein TRAPUB_1709 [Trametes pubescens]